MPHLFPTRNDWLSTVTVPAGLTRRMKVTRPAAIGCRSVGTTKPAGNSDSRKFRRCCAGVRPTSRGWTCWVLTASCSRASSRRRSPGRANRRWNNRGWNRPSKFSTPPLTCGSFFGIKAGQGRPDTKMD